MGKRLSKVVETVLQDVPEYKPYVNEIIESVSDFSLMERNGWTISDLEEMKENYPMEFKTYKIWLNSVLTGESEVSK